MTSPSTTSSLGTATEPRIVFNKTVVLRYRIQLEAKHLAPATINLRLAAVRRLAYEAADVGLLSPDLAAGIRRVKGAKRLGVRLGNWLTAEQSKDMSRCPNGDALIGMRDRAILAVLLGCGVRRSEAAQLTFEHLQRRDDYWVIVDLFGKGGHIRSVPVLNWVETAIDRWTTAAKIESGYLFRCVTKYGTVWGNSITEKVIWHVVHKYAKLSELGKIAPHDLRRTCARLCHEAGGELEQIQFLLGHVSVKTTEQYLGCKQRFRSAVNHYIGIEIDEG
jgi:site-specific recombinase XerD